MPPTVHSRFTLGDGASFSEPQRGNVEDGNHNRVVLLFDMDCFYAQCERVRLGLPVDVELCLFQWNSVLAVTYPAREYGIKRGDSWDDVASKTKQAKKNSSSCYTIHLPIIGHESRSDDTDKKDSVEENNNSSSIEASYKRIFELSREEQLRCQRSENGVRRFHHQGKACLERYRLASMRIFAVVLESLQKRITVNSGHSFILERASIDEFYLDLTEYCYQLKPKGKRFSNGMAECCDEVDVDREAKYDRECSADQTAIAGQSSTRQNLGGTRSDDPIENALNRACQVSHWIRQDIWRILGFTMSAGISTNKTMAKLAASYGKPNGQAVLYPRYFPQVLSETKVTKVRNFGGKLGKMALKLLLSYQQSCTNSTLTPENYNSTLENLKSTATMSDLHQIPLPFLLRSNSVSKESAHFIFLASQGIDHETVKETSGALVKSITAFKSFTATKSHAEIFDRWLTILAKEIIERVAIDTARNKRYPRSCTLNYTYYTTPNGQRPSSGSTRSQRQSRSIRLRFPTEREGTQQEKSDSLVVQAKTKLTSIVKASPLRGVGLSVSNFVETSVQQTTAVTGSIESFFSNKPTSISSSTPPPLLATTNTNFAKRKPENEDPSRCKEKTLTERLVEKHQYLIASDQVGGRTPGATNNAFKESTLDKDLAYAKKLQASFDREEYALSTAKRRKRLTGSKKTRRIDSFFQKR